MLSKISLTYYVLVIVSFLGFKQDSARYIGNFNVEKDLFLAHFDCKTDVDDVLSAAGLKTILYDKRFTCVKYHVTAGTYGTQEGLYVPANELFDICFGKNWSDAHANFKKALSEETEIVIMTLEDGGDIWIAEAGQSDFTAALIKNIKELKPSIETVKRIHVVQHSDWNEKVTSPGDLKYVKENSSYNKIPDGNIVGNGSPGLRTDEVIEIKKYISDPKLLTIWNLALQTANKYNGVDNRYKNEAIAGGGLDFSDVAEMCWIFGFNKIYDIKDFFKEFCTAP